MKSLIGKTALVTGAASGIGRAIARRLAKEGTHLRLLDVNREGLAKIVAELESPGVEIAQRYCDLADLGQIPPTVEWTRRLGGVDVVVNNAGITYYGRTADMSADHLKRLLTIDLLAPMELVLQLLPQLHRRPEAHVVNVASFCGLVGFSKLAAYSAAKFGLAGFSESLRAEYARRNVGVTAVCPGFVDTNLFDAAPLGADRSEPKRPHRWMLTTPERVAEATVRAILKNRATVILPAYARWVYAVKRLTPWLIDVSTRMRFKPRTIPVDVDSQDASQSGRRAA